MTGCPLCTSLEHLKTLTTTSVGGVTYTLNACPTCGGQFWTPFKNPGAAWYEHDERYADRNADPILAANKKHRDVLAFLGKKAGRVLDVGCGVGNFLAFARAHGWECWGIDFDADAIVAGKRTFGLEHLEVASLEEFAAQHHELQFDLITFFDVFEHLDDHNAFLERVRGLLAPGGAIALSVPYRHAWRWLIPADLPPRHLTRWDEASLETILARHCLTTVFCRRFPASIYFITMKLRFRYGAWASFGLVGRAKSRTQATPPAMAAGALRPHVPPRVRMLHALAKAKDLALFGLPALLIWLAILPSRGRYTDFYVVARANGIS